MNADPCGSGSTALIETVFFSLNGNLCKKYCISVDFYLKVLDNQNICIKEYHVEKLVKVRRTIIRKRTRTRTRITTRRTEVNNKNITRKL